MSSAVMAAFCAHLKTFATAQNIQVAWENKSFPPEYDKPYLEAYLLPGDKSGVGVGFDSSEVSRGVFQIDINYIIDTGWGTAMDMAALVCTQFKRGIVGVCKIESVSQGPAIKSDNRYKIPVSVNYVVFTKEQT